MDGWFGFTLAGLALAGSPGPATLSLAAAGAAFGARRALGYLTGLVIGMLGVVIIVASGIGGLIVALPGVGPLVIIMSTFYFVYLAFRIATAPPLAETAGAKGAPTFLGGLILSLVNPKGYAAMAALFAGFELTQGGLVPDFMLKLAILVCIMTTVNLAWLFAGAAMTRLFRDPRANRIINIVFAVLLLASVTLAALV